MKGLPHFQALSNLKIKYSMSTALNVTFNKNLKHIAKLLSYLHGALTAYLDIKIPKTFSQLLPEFPPPFMLNAIFAWLLQLPLLFLVWSSSHTQNDYPTEVSLCATSHPHILICSVLCYTMRTLLCLPLERIHEPAWPNCRNLSNSDA